MADITVKNTLGKAKQYLPLAAGAVGSIFVQKFINKMLSTPTVVNGLGAGTVRSLKNYAVPVATSVIGIGINLGCKNETCKLVGAGICVGGMVNIASQFLWGKNLLNGLNGGIMGSLLGDDDLDGLEGDDDLDGLEGEDEDFGDINLDDEKPMGMINIPISSGLEYSRYPKENEAESIMGLGDYEEYSVL